MADWPLSLPQLPLEAGLRYQAADNSIRSQMDAGAAKARRRFTSIHDEVDLRIIVTKEQADILESFYQVTLAVVGAFNWRHFRKPGFPAAVYQFTAPPEYVPAGGGYWFVTLKFNRLP